MRVHKEHSCRVFVAAVVILSALMVFGAVFPALGLGSAVSLLPQSTCSGVRNAGETAHLNAGLPAPEKVRNTEDTHLPAMPTGELRLMVQGPGGAQVDQAQVFVYIGQNRDLLHQGIVHAGVVSVPLRIPVTSRLGNYIDFKVHVHHPSYGLLIHTWSEPATMAASAHTVVLEYPAATPGSAAVPTGEAPDYPPSGTFRERLDPDISPNPDYYEVLMDVYELHFLPGLSVKVDYTTGVFSSVQAGYKETWPTVTSWSVSGSVTRGFTTTSTWRSTYLTSSKKCRTWFEFRDEYWVLEEEDGDIPGLWHPVKKWIETDAYKHVGGAEFGANVYGDKYDYSEVTSLSRPYGYFFTIAPGNETSKTVSGTQTYNYAFSTPNGFSASASTTYNSCLSVWWANNTSNVTFAAYDNHTDQRIWYVTSTEYDY